MASDAAASPALSAPPTVYFPYTELGDDPASVTFTVTNTGDGDASDPVVIDFGDEFTVEGDMWALSAGASREITVRDAMARNTATILYFQGTVTEGALTVPVTLCGAYATPDLPPADWISDDWGIYALVDLPSAPFPDGTATYNDSTVMIALPSGYADNGDIGTVAHLHGHNATVAEVVSTQYLREQFKLSARNAMLLVPQGPVEAADGDFGKLDLEGGFHDLLVDAQSILYRDGLVRQSGDAPAILTSHSGGYNAVANVLELGGVAIDGVHLFDSLYRREDVYADFVRGGGIFRSVYTSGGGTDDNNEALARQLAEEGFVVSDDFGDGALAMGPLTIAHSDASHGGTVSEDRAYGRWLAASGLPPAPGGPPELLMTRVVGEKVNVEWREDSGGERSVSVETSDDGLAWTEAARTQEAHVTIDPANWIRLRSADADDSEPSDRYGATGNDWLIVDGFDRVLDGSWSKPTHDFAALVGNSLGAGYSVASNEAVAERRVALDEYDHVLWLLGDESTADHTFTDTEMAVVGDYLDGGGSIVVSGSEVGWATDPTWFSSTLHASLAADDAGTLSVEGWTVGDQYPEDYPDVLTGETVLWRWQSGGAAAVAWDDRVVVVGFGVENLAASERAEALAELGAWVGG